MFAHLLLIHAWSFEVPGKFIQRRSSSEAKTAWVSSTEQRGHLIKKNQFGRILSSSSIMSFANVFLFTSVLVIVIFSHLTCERRSGSPKNFPFQPRSFSETLGIEENGDQLVHQEHEQQLVHQEHEQELVHQEHEQQPVHQEHEQQLTHIQICSRFPHKNTQTCIQI